MTVSLHLASYVFTVAFFCRNPISYDQWVIKRVAAPTRALRCSGRARAWAARANARGRMWETDFTITRRFVACLKRTALPLVVPMVWLSDWLTFLTCVQRWVVVGGLVCGILIGQEVSLFESRCVPRADFTHIWPSVNCVTMVENTVYKCNTLYTSHTYGFQWPRVSVCLSHHLVCNVGCI